MTDTMKIFRKIPMIMLVAGLAACESPQDYAGSYDMQHPIIVTEEIVAINLSVPSSGGTVLVSERDGFANFSRIYQLRSKSLITLYVDESKSDGVPRDAIIKRVAGALQKAGIRSENIRVMPGSLGHEGAAPVLATFDAHSVKAPECGDWSDKSTYNWSNTRHKNFGCSYQRNLALSVANPGDFLESQPMSPFGGQRGVVNVIGVVTGESSGTTTTTE